MKNIFLLLIFCWSYSSPLIALAQQSQSTQNSSAKLNKIAAIQRYLSEMENAGISGYVLMLENKKPILQKSLGFADNQSRTPNSAKTVFDIGSIAKTFTAAAILRLSDEKKLQLTDALPKYFTDVPPEKQSITIRQLLTHNSGLTQYVSDSDFDKVSKNEVVARALREPLRAEPGMKEQYGEANYALLAAIVEKASGKEFTAFVRQQFLKPLKLNQTGWYSDSQFKKLTVAKGYLSNQPKGDPQNWQLTWAIIGAGGMLSTPNDLAHWLEAIWTKTVLSAESRQALTERPLKKWSSGWEVHDRDFGLQILKGGNNDFGFSCTAVYIPKQNLRLILLLNSRLEGKNGIHHIMTNEILKLYFG